ncbi:YggT family protein, partial [Staphylococcus epidermidis]|nr:YggT family protein [Staphylococcus epidermidis]
MDIGLLSTIFRLFIFFVKLYYFVLIIFFLILAFPGM